MLVKKKKHVFKGRDVDKSCAVIYMANTYSPLDNGVFSSAEWRESVYKET